MTATDPIAGYRVVFSQKNWSVQRKHIPEKGKHAGEPQWHTETYHGLQLASAMRALFERIANSKLTSEEQLLRQDMIALRLEMQQVKDEIIAAYPAVHNPEE